MQTAITTLRPSYLSTTLKTQCLPTSIAAALTDSSRRLWPSKASFSKDLTEVWLALATSQTTLCSSLVACTGNRRLWLKLSRLVPYKRFRLRTRTLKNSVICRASRVPLTRLPAEWKDPKEAVIDKAASRENLRRRCTQESLMRRFSWRLDLLRRSSWRQDNTPAHSNRLTRVFWLLPLKCLVISNSQIMSKSNRLRELRTKKMRASLLFKSQSFSATI